VAKQPKKAFALRIDQALYDAIERIAAGELRSVNAEIEFLLRRGLERRGVKLAPPIQRRRGRPPGPGAPDQDDHEEKSDD